MSLLNYHIYTVFTSTSHPNDILKCCSVQWSTVKCPPYHLTCPPPPLSQPSQKKYPPCVVCTCTLRAVPGGDSLSKLSLAKKMSPGGGHFTVLHCNYIVCCVKGRIRLLTNIPWCYFCKQFLNEQLTRIFVYINCNCIL